MKTSITFFLIFLLFIVSAVQVSGQQSNRLQIEYVGNMGVAITKGDTALLIDALHDYYKSSYLPSSPAFLEKLFGSTSSYKIVPAMMVTHKHDDHFDSSLVRRALDVHPELKLITGTQLGAFLSNRYRNRYYLADDEMSISIAPNITIKTKKIKHTFQHRHSGIHNTRFEIIWDDKKIVHVGDALGLTEALEGLGDIDVLIIPFWLFMDKVGVADVERLKPRHIILTHVSPEGSPEAYNSPVIKPVRFLTYGEKLVL